MRVREAGEDAAATEVDSFGACQRGLMGPDAPRDSLAGDGKCRRLGQGRLHRPDGPVLEDHRRILRADLEVRGQVNAVKSFRKPLVLGLVLVAVGSASSAYAITWGQPDGNGHPSTGALVFFSP